MKRSLGILCLLALASVSPTLGCAGASAQRPPSPPRQSEDQPSHPAWALELEQTADYGGIGSLEVTRGEQRHSLELLALAVRVEPAGHLAEFEVEHSFQNDSDEVLEGTFRFTLPPDAIVTGLAMEIGGNMMEGEIVEREKAVRTYEKIVESMQDPALLEWEQGKTFKLRVFPIEAQSKKKLVLRYLAPLQRDPARGPLARRVVYPVAGTDMQATIPHFSLAVHGKTVVDKRDLPAQGDVRAIVPNARAVGDALVERRKDGDFAALRLRPDWSEIDDPGTAPRTRRHVFMVDTSRSALESRALARASLETLVRGLDDGDEFMVIASDLEARPQTPGPVPATAANLDAALAFLDGIEPDGASDLGTAFRALEAALQNPQRGQRIDVVYIGDGTPTWGEVEPGALRAVASETLGDTAFHAIALGKGPDLHSLRAIAGNQGGRVVRPDSPAELAKFATFLKHAPAIKTLSDVHLSIEGVAPEDIELPPTGTWFEGDEPIVYVRRAPESGPMPVALRLSARVGARAVHQDIVLGTPLPASQIAKQWAARRIDRIQADSEHKDEAIALSEVFGVLSKHTALLVLESEEAFKQAQIERRRAAEQASRNPAITGADLESLGQARTSLSPGDLQPGDPEILIPAPEDALSVTVVFPFGDTKVARWEPELGKWSVRFLVDAATRPGKYEVQIRIKHADGRIETRTAHYTVDMTPAQVSVEIVPLRGKGGVYEVVARQTLGAQDRARTRMDGLEGTEGAQSVSDAKRVEVVMPDGQTLTLRRVAPGEFRKHWKPRSEVSFPARIEVATTDRALNVGRSSLTIEAP